MTKPAFFHCDPPGEHGDTVTVLCLVDGPGATWRISFERPLRSMRAQGRVRLCCLDEAAFTALPLDGPRLTMQAALADVRPDVVVLSRFSGVATPPILDEISEAKLPFVYHLDDDLFSVPADLGQAKHEFYKRPERIGNMGAACAASDLIYTSTAALRIRLGRFGFSPPIVHGQIYCGAQEPFQPFSAASAPVIGYMGTSGHVSDLDVIVPAISAVMAARAEVRFEVFGTIGMPPAIAASYPDRVSARPPAVDYDTFLQSMRELGWSVALAPLCKTAFNSVKADTKFVEYTVAGLPVVVSDGQVYRAAANAGAALSASTPDGFADAIRMLMDRRDVAADQVSRAQDRLRSDHSLEAHGLQVMRILESVMEAKRSGNRPNLPACVSGAS